MSDAVILIATAAIAVIVFIGVLAAGRFLEDL